MNFFFFLIMELCPFYESLLFPVLDWFCCKESLPWKCMSLLKPIIILKCVLEKISLKGKFLLSCWETQTVTTFDLEIRNVKGGNKKNLPWNTTPREMHSSFTSNSTIGKPDCFCWLWKTSPKMQIPVKQTSSQRSENKDAGSLVPLKDFNAIL